MTREVANIFWSTCTIENLVVRSSLINNIFLIHCFACFSGKKFADWRTVPHDVFLVG